MLWMCPCFLEPRRNLWIKVSKVVMEFHLTGCLKMDGEKVSEYSKRRKEVIELGKRTRDTLDWDRVIANLDYEGFFRGYWKTL